MLTLQLNIFINSDDFSQTDLSRQTTREHARPITDIFQHCTCWLTARTAFLKLLSDTVHLESKQARVTER
jgi:hypothetical protein